MNDFDSAYRWLLFQIGLTAITRDELLFTEKSKWEPWRNSAWHYSDSKTLLEAFMSLKEKHLIAEMDSKVRLTEQGTACWERSFSPIWTKAHIFTEYDDGISAVESGSIETCVRVFQRWCFLEFVKLDSIFVTQLDGFDPLYWKRISPAFSLQFKVDRSPPNVRSPISLLATEYAKQMLEPANHPLLKSCRSLEIKILKWHSSTETILEWYTFPDDEYLARGV